MCHSIFIADIGGTNCRFAYFSLHKKNLLLQAYKVFPSQNLYSMQDVLHCVQQMGITLNQADMQIWGIAGHVPPDSTRAYLTNGHLELDISAWKHTLEKGKKYISCRLVNDFVLQACASLALKEEFFESCVSEQCLQKIEAEESLGFASEITLKTVVPASYEHSLVKGVRAVLGAGTGLGLALFVPHSRGTHHDYSILSTEGGHVSFVFYGSEEERYAACMQDIWGTKIITAEHVLSGRGLSALHYFVHGTNIAANEVALLWSMPTRTEKVELTLALYARFLGRFCRHTVLNTLCTGGIYLGGGVLTKNSNIFRHPEFLQEFYNSPVAQSVLYSVPIYVFSHGQTGLWGGAYMARSILHGGNVDIF